MKVQKSAVVLINYVLFAVKIFYCSILLKIIELILCIILFYTAIDLQNCGVEYEAALGLLSLATTNQSVEVIDLRLNKIGMIF